MEATQVYLSAKCIAPYLETLYTPPDSRVVVKVHRFGYAYGGFDGNYKLYRVSPGVLSSYQLTFAREALQTLSASVPEEVSEWYIQSFANLAWYACCAHGENFPTWAGELYLEPFDWKRGGARTKLRSYLVTEAPGLDCGHWEGDQLPLRG